MAAIIFWRMVPVPFVDTYGLTIETAMRTGPSKTNALCSCVLISRFKECPRRRVGQGLWKPQDHVQQSLYQHHWSTQDRGWK